MPPHSKPFEQTAVLGFESFDLKLNYLDGTNKSLE